MTHDQLHRRVRLLSGYSAFSSVLLLVLVAAAFSPEGKRHFDEIDVERLNVVEPDGQLALVLANESRLPGPIINGRENYDRNGIAGILFYNGKGDEAGGLVFGSAESDSTREHEVHLSFDGYNDDQVLTLNHSEDNDQRSTQIRFVDRDAPFGFSKLAAEAWLTRNGTPEEQERAQQWLDDHRDEYSEGVADRLIFGSFDRLAKIQLNDTEGRPRIRLAVDSLDAAYLEFLDENGDVVQKFP